jgi:hypothetical protein
VLVDTRRPEVDTASSGDYHYDGAAGIALSSWIRRALFALDRKSKDLLISDDITRESRILLHRDVRERLAALAPFIHWDTHPAPIAAHGRIVFVTEGYTTSRYYPYAERVDLGGESVNYARSAVRATVDAFSGKVNLYLVDDSDPIARAWADAFPTLFRPADELPAALRPRVRYPMDLFRTQATAYERFHTTRPDVFASGSDVWSAPTSLSGSIDVAGDIQFDESDEDQLRYTMKPGYKFSAPPGRTGPRLLLSTLYSPHRGQNLVGTLDGWIDAHGRPALAARTLPRDPVTLGPAQVSRVVFATPRVSNLLGLTNLELRDLGKNSLDTVSLGEPHLIFLPGGVIQIQSLYKGASGPGVSRIIGVTAYVNGRAAVGANITHAVQQALHKPPRLRVLHPVGRSSIEAPVAIRFHVNRARREVITITSPAGRAVLTRQIRTGRGIVSWVPTAAGLARARVEVEGLDGTSVARSTTFRVLSPRPRVRLTSSARARRRAVVGRSIRFPFELENAVSAVAEISTRSGTFTRRYLIRDGTAFMEWTPQTSGPAVLRIRVRGRQGQTATETARVTVERARRIAAPTVTLVQAPKLAIVGRESKIAFRVSRARAAVARIAGAEGRARVWRFVRPSGTVTFAWTPARPGTYRLTVSARRSDGTTTQTATRLTARRAP